MRFAALTVLWVLTNCSSSTESGSGSSTTPGAAGMGEDSPSAGTERGPCYGNGTCNAGLVCASDLCVKLGGGTAGSTSGGSSVGGDAATSAAGAADMAQAGTATGDAGARGMNGDAGHGDGGESTSNAGSSGNGGSGGGGGTASGGTGVVTGGTGGTSGGVAGTANGGGGGMGGTASGGTASGGTGNGGTASGAGGTNGGAGGTNGGNGGMAGKGGSGVSGGTGGTGNGGGCDALGNCDACSQCEGQGSAACQKATTDCQLSGQCAQLINCLDKCAGDDACAQKCKAIVLPQTLQAWNALSSCVCAGCTSSCAGDYGYECPSDTGGTGGTGGGPNCDVGACGVCVQCSSQVPADCGSAVQACKLVGPCNLLLMCTNQCNGDEQCINKCLSVSTPDVLKLWAPVADCFCQSCSTTCADNAGYGCPPGAGGTGGTGGSGGAPTCDDSSADCGACSTCVAQQNGNCANAYALCAKDPACNQYEQCVASCSDQTCINKCKAGTPPNGFAEYQEKLLCTCQQCPSNCQGVLACP